MGKLKKKLAKNRKRSQGQGSSSPPQESAGSSSTAIAGGGGTGNEGGNVPLRQNPFEIPVIVRQIMGHLNKVSDLKGFRLMSRVCLDESLGKWRDTAVFGLRDPRAELALKHTLGLEDNAAAAAAAPQPLYWSKPPRPVTLYRLQEKPFANYKLKPGLSYPPTTLSATNPHTLHFFWENLGPSVKYLDLSDCFFKEGLHLEGLKWVLGSCPNIEELKLAPFRTTLLMDYLSRYEYRPSFYRLQCMQDIKWWKNNRENEEEEAGRRFQQMIDESRTELMFRTAPVGFSTADKLKSLSIDCSEFHIHRRFRTDELFFGPGGYRGLCVDFLKLMPNLKVFSVNHVEYPGNICGAIASERGNQATIAVKTKPIHLEKISLSGTHTMTSWVPFEGVSDYLAVAEPPKLKILQLDGIHFNSIRFWRNPSQLKNVLNGVRKDVEELNLSFHCKRTSKRYMSLFHLAYDANFESLLHSNPSLDLFDLKFSKLTKLKLVFDYSERNTKSFSLNFALFRGTPNLKHFHFGARGLYRDMDNVKDYENDDLVLPKETSWYLDQGIMRRTDNFVDPLGAEEEDEPILLEDDIVLDHMKVFHYEGTLTVENWKLLGQWMKNLEVFEAILDNDTFPVPFQVWGRGGGGKLRKVTLLMFEEGQVENMMISEHKKINPEVAILSKVQRERGAGWTKREDKCYCEKYFDRFENEESSTED